MPRTLSPALLSRIDRLSGCQGRWIVDCRAIEGNYSYAFRSPGDPFQLETPEGLRYWRVTPAGEVSPYRIGSLEDAALYCAHTSWQSRLLFVSEFLAEDYSWPGGYSPSAVYRSNARVFRDEFRRELENGADGDGPDIALDVRFVTDEMLETLESLESYPLISEDDHSELEMELQEEAWEQWAASEWRQLVCKALDAALPEDCERDADEILDTIPDADAKLRELFNACAESSNTYWQEEQGDQWIDLERVVGALDLADLRGLTGLALLPPDQQWRKEPYPWPDGSTTPLIKTEVV